jgi:hypothetical protein
MNLPAHRAGHPADLPVTIEGNKVWVLRRERKHKESGSIA